MPPSASSQFLALVRQRRSCRQYDPARPVPDEIIDYCLECARLAPSACNKQPWHFIIVREPDRRQAIFEHGRMPGIPHEWLEQVPVIVALCAEKKVLTHKLAPLLSGIPYHYIDCAIAGEHFVLAATEQGLGSCWIGWFKPPVVRRLLGVPRHLQMLSLIALGYPLHPEPSPPTSRQELNQFVHREHW